MACPAVITGDAFVSRVLSHIDCQAQYLGSYGYVSLSDPGSLASVFVTSLLTLFVALWGYRLLMGPAPQSRDILEGVLKVGIVLTLAFSWPAFRTVVHEVVLEGPAQIASSISTPGLPSSSGQLVERLQAVDNAIVGLTGVGTGRWSSQFIDGGSPGGTFAGTVLEDESSLGWARLSFLTGMFGALALLRIGAGLLLALAPLAAGLLLFEATRGLFAGWLRGLVFVIAAATAVTFTLAIELAILEPWLADALRVRQLGYAAPSAPIELLAMTTAFALVHFAIIWFMARVTFHGGWLAVASRTVLRHGEGAGASHHQNDRAWTAAPNRAESISNHLETRVRMEQRAGYNARMPASGSASAREPANANSRSVDGLSGTPAGGTSSRGYAASARRNSGGSSLSSARRDQR